MLCQSVVNNIQNLAKCMKGVYFYRKYRPAFTVTLWWFCALDSLHEKTTAAVHVC